jgi:hypothetical protein
MLQLSFETKWGKITFSKCPQSFHCLNFKTRVSESLLKFPESKKAGTAVQ